MKHTRRLILLAIVFGIIVLVVNLVDLSLDTNVSEEEVKNYRVREAGRAVVMDRDGMIALLHVTKESYYKLPGGGIEETEDKIITIEYKTPIFKIEEGKFNLTEKEEKEYIQDDDIANITY